MSIMVQPPALLRLLLSNMVWRLPTAEKKLFITVDDGPIPEITNWTLDTLKSFGAKATFFCVGENVKKHPEIYQQILYAGHKVGNHTFKHLVGWDTAHHDYVNDVARADKYIKSNLFRPPHGKISFSQRRELAKKYHVVMWGVLSQDYDTRLSPMDCWKNVEKHTRPGSVIVFHDNIKAKERLQYTLPKTLEHFSNLGYTFDSIQLPNIVTSASGIFGLATPSYAN